MCFDYIAFLDGFAVPFCYFFLVEKYTFNITRKKLVLYTRIFFSNTTCFSSSASFRCYFLLFFKKRLIKLRCLLADVISLRYGVFSYRIKVSVKFCCFWNSCLLSVVKSSVQRPFRLLLCCCCSLALSISFQFFVTHKNNTHAHLSMIPLRTWDRSWWLVCMCVCLSVIMCIDFRSLSLPNR